MEASLLLKMITNSFHFSKSPSLEKWEGCKKWDLIGNFLIFHSTKDILIILFLHYCKFTVSFWNNCCCSLNIIIEQCKFSKWCSSMKWIHFFQFKFRWILRVWQFNINTNSTFKNYIKECSNISSTK